ncbi:cadherin domain-containing protein [Anatilimnocola floriformis]|uniref:cadherin domain-containing protein n=1 Tax=Anatilimnocola floriformis TaxID=2948575 RepID=UPI0020C24B53|nr:cadherin domain-containing protein [Anatilimnocola floriformis]
MCHATTVLAWARVNGVSPLAGKNVSVPWNGSPGVYWNGTSYSPTQLLQSVQMTANGATPLPHGSVGDRTTDTDDVTVDGRIITAENNFSARQFGRVIAQRLWAEDTPPNVAPVVTAASFAIDENSELGSAVGQVIATDANAGQTLSYSIVGGNTNGAFAINSATGRITVASVAAINFETTPSFALTIRATDSATPSLSGEAIATITLRDIAEAVTAAGPNVLVQGTSGSDLITIATNPLGLVTVGFNGVAHGPFTLGAGGRVIVNAGDGGDRVTATNSTAPVTVYGEDGNDVLIGGSNDDIFDGGAGIDRLIGGLGADILFGGADTDILEGREGNDLIIGGDGDDRMIGFTGNDVLIGGLGRDIIDGGMGEDLLIGGRTSYDANSVALAAILAEWNSGAALATRRANLQTGLAGGVRVAVGDTVTDDQQIDCLLGGEGDDWLLLQASDYAYRVMAGDLI